MLPTVGELVKGTTAEFVCYRDGELWYTIRHYDVDTLEQDRPCGVCFLCGKALSYPHDDCKEFQFPVPISDTGTGIFPNKLKTITLMRWVRKHLEKKQKGEA